MIFSFLSSQEARLLFFELPPFVAKSLVPWSSFFLPPFNETGVFLFPVPFHLVARLLSWLPFPFRSGEKISFFPDGILETNPFFSSFFVVSKEP